MDPGGQTVFETGLWIIPLVFVGTIAVLSYLIYRWQRRAIQVLKSIHSDLRHSRSSLVELDRDSQNYAENDREPFGSLAKRLSEQCAQVEQLILFAEQRYVNAQERARRLALRGWRAVLGAPFFWFEWRKALDNVLSLRREVDHIPAALEAGRNLLHTLDRHGWEAARLSRRADEQQRRLEQLVEELKARHAQGDAFDRAASQGQAIRKSLTRIPAYFFTGGEAEVLEQAQKETIADVYEVLSGVQPALEQALGQVQKWGQQIREAEARNAALQQRMAELEQAMASLPAGLAFEPLAARQKQLATIAANLHATLGRVEVESLPELEREAERVIRAAQEMTTEIKQARRQVFALDRTMADLKAGMKAISDRFASSATRADHPLVWNESRSRLTEISRQLAALSQNTQPRLADEVEKDLAAANTLLVQQKELDRHGREVVDAHLAYLDLLAAPEIQEGLEWIRKAQLLLAQAAAYDPENWPRGDGMASFPAELAQLAERHRRLVPASAADPISESTVSVELEKARALAVQHKSARFSAEKIQARLLDIRSVEKNAQDLYEHASRILQQIGLLSNSNELLRAKIKPEAERYQTRLDQLGAELQQRQQKTVEEKAKALQVLLGELEESGNIWLSLLNSEVENRKAGLGQQLARLGEMAALEERPVQEAERLLAQDMAASASQKSRQRPTIPLNDLLGQMKARSDIWQACLAAGRELDDLVRPLEEAYQQTLEQYEMVREQLSRAAGWVSEKRSWPPASQNLEAEGQEFTRMEENWRRIETQPNRAIWAVRQLGEMAGRYQNLGEKIRQAMQQIDEDQRRVRELEAGLEDLVRLWQARVQDVPEASGEIRKLVGGLNREWDGMKGQYRQGALSYLQVIQALEALYQNTLYTQITLEDGRSIRINSEPKAHHWRG